MALTRNSIPSETGAQLLQRLQHRRSLHRLDDTLFPHGLESSTALEVYGKTGVGKSELLLRLTVNCITPAVWQGHQVGGMGLSAVYMDNDHHFCMRRIVELIKARLQRAAGHRHLSEDQMSEFLTSCLARLQLVRCTDSAQMVITLHSIQQIASNMRDCSLLIIDSISAFYWQDRLTHDSLTQVDTYYRHTATILRKLMDECRLTILFSRQHLINYGGGSGGGGDFRSAVSRWSAAAEASAPFAPDERHYLGRSVQSITSWRIVLTRTPGDPVVVAEVKGRHHEAVLRYRIAEGGMECLEGS